MNKADDYVATCNDYEENYYCVHCCLNVTAFVQFIKSLTKKQKALAEKQGFLKPDDLTKEQRVLLELGKEKNTDMTFNIDGEKIRIKSGDDKAKATSLGISA